MPELIKIRKKDGTYEFFETKKIETIIDKVIESSKGKESSWLKQSKKLAQEVIQLLEKHFTDKIIPTAQDVENVLIEVLQSRKLSDAATTYFNAQKKKKELTPFKTYMGIRDDIGLTENSLRVLTKKYLLRNEQGQVIETPKKMFERVAKSIASVDGLYKSNIKRSEQEFFEMLSNLEFLPNTPCLMNAGTQLGQLAACFVLPIEDSLKSIFHTLEIAALIHQSGGGTGFNFSKIRPKGDIVKSTKGVASGPISFMKIYDTTTDVVKQGGKRRGANMGILDVSHPDIREFVTSKSKDKILNNFNISVAVTDSFMDALFKDQEIALINPNTKKVVEKIKAKELFDLIVKNSWESGDPGLVFIDEINRWNPTPESGKIESTNPCGEQPLLPYESCVLGSINLAKMFVKGKFSWEKLKQIVHKSVHFLDNVIDANKYPVPEIELVTKSNRKIGLGVMGFAEALIKQEIAYDSNQAIEFAEKLMKFIHDEGHKKSQELGRQRGSFTSFAKSIYAKKYEFLRNATVTTIAPTGTISILAGTTSSIEPLFAVSFVREIMEGTQLLETSKEFEEIAKEKGFYNTSLMMKIARQGSVQGIKEISKNIQKIFKTAFDISPEWHVKMQSAFQKYSDNAVSKTVNLPENAKIEDIKKVYELAHKLKCKGITVFRYGSKQQQVLTLAKEKEPLKVKNEYSGGCPGLECNT